MTRPLECPEPDQIQRCHYRKSWTIRFGCTHHLSSVFWDSKSQSRSSQSVTLGPASPGDSLGMQTLRPDYWIRYCDATLATCALTVPPGDSDAQSSLRTTIPEDHWSGLVWVTFQALTKEQGLQWAGFPGLYEVRQQSSPKQQKGEGILDQAKTSARLS